MNLLHKALLDQSVQDSQMLLVHMSAFTLYPTLKPTTMFWVYTLHCVFIIYSITTQVYFDIYMMSYRWAHVDSARVQPHGPVQTHVSLLARCRAGGGSHIDWSKHHEE